MFPNSRSLTSPASTHKKCYWRCVQTTATVTQKTVFSTSLRFRYFLCRGRNLFRLISHPLYGAAILLNPSNLLFMFHPLPAASALTCLLGTSLCNFLSSPYPAIPRISVSLNSNSQSPCLICPNVTPILVKFPRSFAILLSVVKETAATIRTQ